MVSSTRRNRCIGAGSMRDASYAYGDIGVTPTLYVDRDGQSVRSRMADARTIIMRVIIASSGARRTDLTGTLSYMVSHRNTRRRCINRTSTTTVQTNKQIDTNNIQSHRSVKSIDRVTDIVSPPSVFIQSTVPSIRYRTVRCKLTQKPYTRNRFMGSSYRWRVNNTFIAISPHHGDVRVTERAVP